MNRLCLCLLFLLVSCAGFVNQVHRQIDRQERGEKKNQSSEQGEYVKYRERDRFKPENDRRPIKNPVTYSLGSNPSGHQRLPQVKREYRPQRYQAKDFIDDDNSGSLWADNSSNSSLFTYQVDKRSGDMVIINVLEDLRNQISSELKRTFPDKPKRSGKEAEKNSETDKKTAQTPAPAAGPENEMDMKIYDKVSGTVVEEVSKDYILLRGRKDVIFKKEKRSIEIQALVSRKDIMENDYVNSDKLLESKVFILRENQ